MHISELIKKLEEFKEEYGDLPVDYGVTSEEKTLFNLTDHIPVEAIQIIFEVEQLKDRQLFSPKVVLC